MMGFAHLHLHSQYSLLDGAIRLKDLFPRLTELGMNTVALTDHGNMFGALDFYKAAKKANIKPIFGCETYVADGDMTDRTKRKSFHLVLLAKNLEGYRNLTFLVSKAFLDGFYYHPRIDKKLLTAHSGGLIGLSACLGGEIPQAMLNRGIAQAEEVVGEYKSIFAPGDFYLEVQSNGLSEQQQVNDDLIKLAGKLDVGLVATNDCHYIDRKDARAHDCLMCVQTGKLLNDPDRMRHDTDEFYLKSPQEMEQAFYNLPQAIESAAAIAEQCNVEIDLTQCYLPQYAVPQGHDLETYLRELTDEGLAQRFEEFRSQGRTFDEKAYHDRIDHEMSVIQSMGFPGYFLIVWDFINYAKEVNIPVGPGRGSGAGSLVAYALRITDIDPLPYDLLFERFLNPERVSMPDFDIDFCMNRRDEVIKYVSDKYGNDNVGQIVTMHQLKARGVTRDVARAMGVSYAEADRVAKLIPEPIQGKSVTIPQALQQEPRLRDLSKENAKIADLLEIASRLEGLNRHAGTHAAGLVIGDKPLWEYVPCFRGQNNELVSQFAKNEVEEVGLVKFDFLGLKTLTVIAGALEQIRRRSHELDVSTIPIDDNATFEMMCAGHTTAVFQFESSGIKELLKKLRPDCFEDIIAAVALYRPGPLEGGMVDDFVKRKHGEKKVTYIHPWLEPILKETYGVIVYQEQVMSIASALAGFTLGQADLLRRAMGKKKPEEMAKQKEFFLAGAAKKEVDAKIAEQVFDLMEVFAGYGFNKSHSAAYGLISYQTAYLKCHYPAEFMAGVLTCEKDNIDNLTKFIGEARSMHLAVLRPDIDESEPTFSVVDPPKQQEDSDEQEDQQSANGDKAEPRKEIGFIRFGLGAVRNVGEGAVEAIVEARKDEPFASLFDFCERVDGRKVNRRVIEALIKAGAFDGVAAKAKVHRAQLFDALETALERALSAQRDRESGQTNLLGMLETQNDEGKSVTLAEVEEIYPDVPPWDPRKLLANEKESLGFYLSGHPLDRYRADLRRHASTTIGGLDNEAERSEVTVGGMVSDFRERPLRSGKGRMAILNLEDRDGQVEVVVFSKPFEEFEAILKSGEPLLVTARLAFEGDGENRIPRLQLKSVMTLAQLRLQKTTEMHVRIDAASASEDQLDKLKEILLRHVGECRTHIHVTIPERSNTDIVLSERFSVEPTDEMLLEIERLFGDSVAQLK